MCRWLLACLVLPLAVCMAAEPQRRVAITFDDIPGSAIVHDTCNEAAVMAFNRRLLHKIAKTGVVATAFVVPGSLCPQIRQHALPRVMTAWRKAGHGLGNHSYSHGDYNGITTADYLADIARADAAMDGFLPAPGSGQRYFRAPLLHTGNTPEKRQALLDWLSGHDYRQGIVSIDNQEWVFATQYAHAKRAGDAARMQRIVEGYVRHIEEAFVFFESESAAVFGREPAQVLLLHANEINADHFDAIARIVRARGYAVVPLPEALADPAYAVDDGYVGPRGLSWIHRHSLRLGRSPGEEPREPAWLTAP